MVLLLFVGSSSSWYCCGVGDSSTGGGCSHWFKVRSELVVVLHVLLWCIMVREYLYSPTNYAIVHVADILWLQTVCHKLWSCYLLYVVGLSCNHGHNVTL